MGMSRVPVSRLWQVVVSVVVVCAFMVNAQAALPEFTKVVDRYGPAVVNISTTQKVSRKESVFPHGSIPMPEGTPFDDFFRRFFDGEGERGGPERDYNARSLGSGFIISRDGYILTNNHVIRDADEIIVRLSDRRELEATLVGTDERSDVALLKVEADDLPTVKIGQSSDLRVGEWVLAIGSPFDFDHSATAGIVSALGRSLPNENYVPFIQTDVAINPGNSGGPLFNLDGEVVGINAQIYSRTGGFMGLSFTIPIDLAMDVVTQLKTDGHVTRGWLGVLIQDVTRELAESFGMAKPGGALVSQVLPDSPAEQAGIEVGDVILEFAGREVSDSAALPPMVGVSPVGKNVPVKVLRQGAVKKLTVVLGELPAKDEMLQTSAESNSDFNQRLNIEVTDLSDEDRELLGVKENGVLVKEVKSGPANDAGIEKGDVITMLDGVTVDNAAQFKTLVDALEPGKSVAILVQRRSGPAFLAIKIPRPASD